jgi:hypothetical protein
LLITVVEVVTRVMGGRLPWKLCDNLFPMMAESKEEVRTKYEDEKLLSARV